MLPKNTYFTDWSKQKKSAWSQVPYSSPRAICLWYYILTDLDHQGKTYVHYGQIGVQLYRPFTCIGLSHWYVVLKIEKYLIYMHQTLSYITILVYHFIGHISSVLIKTFLLWNSWNKCNSLLNYICLAMGRLAKWPWVQPTHVKQWRFKPFYVSKLYYTFIYSY